MKENGKTKDTQIQVHISSTCYNYSQDKDSNPNSKYKKIGNTSSFLSNNAFTKELASIKFCVARANQGLTSLLSFVSFSKLMALCVREKEVENYFIYKQTNNYITNITTTFERSINCQG